MRGMSFMLLSWRPTRMRSEADRAEHFKNIPHKKRGGARVRGRQHCQLLSSFVVFRQRA